ncbi:MAG: glycosyltransferase [Woeseia sp.]
MKVLHVETGRNLYGGAQQVLWLIDGLARNGVESTLVCSTGSAISQLAEEQGLRTIALPCAGDLDLRFGWRLKNLIETERPHLVHCHSRRGADLLGGRAARRAGVPALVSRRVDNHELPRLAAMRYSPYRKIIAISEAIAMVLRADGVEPDRIKVIRSAVDAERFAKPPDRKRFLELIGDKQGQRIIFCVAQLIARKGQRFLIEAMAQLVPRYPDLQLFLFGRGPTGAALRAEVKRLGLQEHVTFAGFRRDLDSYLGCAELLVHPATEEGLGVAALKAAASGVPVIAFAAGGLAEAVADGETGLLVPPCDVAALAKSIGTLLDDPERCRQFGERGRQRMRAEFSIAAMVDAHLQLYRSIIND